MHEIRATKAIDAPKADIWHVLDDFGDVDDWDATIDSASLVAGPDTGEGATRECVLGNGHSFEETIIEYQPESTLKIEATDTGPLPVKEFITEWSVREFDDTRTEVTLDGRLIPKYGPVGWLLAKAVLNSKIEEGYEEALEALADHVE